MDDTWFGPAPGEGPARRYGPARRVAVLSDVHANTAALDAVLDDVLAEAPDLVVVCGDLTWGPEPAATLRRVHALGGRALFVRGNAERAVVAMAGGTRPAGTDRERWMVRRHCAEAVDTLAGFAFSVVVEIAGLGAVRFCHGSPRSDTELVTPATPADRLAELAAGITETTLVTGHTHIQFERLVGGLRSLNPGSVGLPYHDGPPGTAYWAMLGPGVVLRRSSYPVAEAIARAAASGDPGAGRITDLLTHPPTPGAITAQAERLVFSD
jgi:putative phosphoesterase